MPEDESLFSLAGALGKGKGKLAAVGEAPAPGEDVMEQLEVDSEDEQVGWAGLAPGWLWEVYGASAGRGGRACTSGRSSRLCNSPAGPLVIAVDGARR